MPTEFASDNFMSVRLAPSTTTARGIPRPSLNWLRLVPRLPRSVGLAPVAAPPKGADAASPHPCFAIAKQCLPIRHSLAILLARCAQIRLAAPRAESDSLGCSSYLGFPSIISQ